MNQPPKRALRFLRWFCREDYIDEIEGDLTEIFRKQSEKSPRAARWKFAWSVLRYFRPDFIKSFRKYQPASYTMYKSYFTSGWRYLLKQKGYSAINIGGLAIGMMVAMLNALWILDEYAWNTSFANYDRIAYVVEVGQRLEGEGMYKGNTMTYPLYTELNEKYHDQFKRIARSTQMEKVLAAGDRKLVTFGMYADPAIAEIFSLRMIKGSRSGLTQPQSILISESMATSLFDDQDPIGAIVRLGNRTDATVAGVYEDFPKSTDLYNYKFFAAWSIYESENPWIAARAVNDLRNHFLKIYMEIAEGDSFEAVIPRIKGALHFDPVDLEERTKSKSELSLYPMREWRLYPHFQRQGDLEPVMLVKLIGAIGVFVLTLACINFVNLSTARAERRSKEVGIRKTIGSIRSQLVNQFFCESLLVVLFAFIFAMLLTQLALPGFNLLTGKDISIPWTEPKFWLAAIGFILFTSILAGSYPALYLSSFNPVKVLKGTFKAGRFASLPRKVLVVFQFSISVVLIIGTAVVYEQIQYAKNRPVGYDREGLIMMRKRSGDFAGKYHVLRNELKNTGVVEEVSESMGPMTEIYSGNDGWDWKGRDGDANPSHEKSFATLSVSHTHGRTARWQFVMGRDFDPENPADSGSLVINESALKRMKLEQPIGEEVSWTWWADKRPPIHYKIIGVVKDMVMESPYADPEPTMFYIKGHNGNPSWINIRLKPEVNAADALPKIQAVFNAIVPAVPFDYVFADEEYARKFAKEQYIGNLAAIFSGLAIFISCLGLLGLASFVAESRTKEIGIRKVMGASVTRLWKMLSGDFVLLVLVACALSMPFAYYLMHGWLMKFTYRTELSPWILVGTCLGAVGITLFTISYQAIRAATANPVTSLRSE